MASRPHPRRSWRGLACRRPYTGVMLRKCAWIADVARRRQSGSSLQRINAESPNRMTRQSVSRTTLPAAYSARHGAAPPSALTSGLMRPRSQVGAATSIWPASTGARASPWIHSASECCPVGCCRRDRADRQAVAVASLTGLALHLTRGRELQGGKAHLPRNAAPRARGSPAANWE